MIVALAALFVALSGVGVAATGGNFILGQSNSAANTTSLGSGVTTGPTLELSNTAGKPAARFDVNATSPPFVVTNTKKVQYLNADNLDGFDSGHFLPKTGKAADSDKLDGRDSSGFLPSQGDIQLWYSPWGYLPWGEGTTVFPASGPTVSVHRTSAGGTAVVRPLDQPQSIFGTTLKLKGVTICFRAAGAVIVSTALIYGETGQDNVAYSDTYTHSSPEKTCYEVTPSTPTVISGSLFLYLGLYFGGSPDHIDLFSVRVTLGT